MQTAFVPNNALGPQLTGPFATGFKMFDLLAAFNPAIPPKMHEVEVAV